VSDLPLIPDHWEWAKVGEVGTVQLGRQRAPKYHRGRNMRPYLRVANVFEDRIDLSDVMEMDFGPSDYKQYKLEDGEILLNEGQSPEFVGRPAMYRGELPGACFTNSLIRFKPGSKVDGEFALLVFLHYLHNGRFQREARITTNIAHLSSRRFSEIEFPVPSVEEQKQIVEDIRDRLVAVAEAQADVEATVRLLKVQRQGVFQLADLAPHPPVALGDILERIEAGKWLLGDQYWVNAKVEPGEIARTLATVAATPDELRSAFQKELADGRDSIDDVRPFALKPLIEIGPRTYLPVDIEALDDALMGDGLFWRLRPGNGSTQQDRSDFGETLGHLLEAHCVEVAEACYAKAGGMRKPFFREFRYSEGDSADITVTDPGASAFIEIGINRPNLRDTVFAGDLASFEDDVEKIILPRAEQLNRKIDHARDGRLVFQGAPAGTLRRVYPVVCLWDGFPLGRYLYERILRVVRDAGYLLQDRVAPLRVISVEELELLCGLASKGSLLTDLLEMHERSASPEASLSEFLRERHLAALELPPPLDQDFDAIGKRLAKQLFG
jgi:hypothetical protein